ncbi:hypothetical protein EVAR_11206_1 [Eumeta japonica]|uniref:Uncharacterized protein n=1 Tax=Eumeta variegata TaxID=151549 RepID=A0A4C1U459_EUMVA|nr:hypothetical protein EVAR_11206_1 [Eumeta japonica]
MGFKTTRAFSPARRRAPPPAVPAKKSSHSSKKSQHARWLAKAREDVAKLKLEGALVQLQWIEAEEIDKESSRTFEIEAPNQEKIKFWLKSQQAAAYIRVVTTSAALPTAMGKPNVKPTRN